MDHAALMRVLAAIVGAMLGLSEALKARWERGSEEMKGIRICTNHSFSASSATPNKLCSPCAN